LKHLQEAREAANATGSAMRGPVWYKATYQIAATNLYKNKLDQADTEVNDLIARIKFTLKKVSGSQSKYGKALEEFLKSILPSAEILQAGIWLNQGEAEKADQKVESIVRNELKNLSYRARYNLACFYSRQGGISKDEDERTDSFDEALDHLQYAVELDPTLAQWASDDPALKWLREDSKTKVRSGKTAKEAFDEIRAMYVSPVKANVPDALPLAGVAIIGDTYARQLKERGIVTEDDLILKADTPAAQRALADVLGINDDLVRRWALLADLMRIGAIDAQHANLLEAAEVRSLRDLRGSNPEELTRLLHQLNQAQSIVAGPPSAESVRQWVSEAKHTKPKVSDFHPPWWLEILLRKVMPRWWPQHRGGASGGR
jgi:tetratricopeptide (TPR) repeat protein